MGKFVLPPVKKILKKKKIYDKKKEPVWVYLEKEMLQNISKKPYNEKVGKWLRFLKDLKYHYFCQAKRQERRLKREVGPRWYIELSSQQKDVLSRMRADIHQDLLEDLPRRVRKDLSDLGVTVKTPNNMLMQAMSDSFEDPGVFFWRLYTAVYKMSPNMLRTKYEISAMVMLSCLVFIDMEECIKSLDLMTQHEKSESPDRTKKRKKNTQPKVKYGEYLQKIYAPCYMNKSPKKKQPKAPPPLGYKFKLRSEESYEKLRKNDSFLDIRIERNKKAKPKDRICNYKFWEPPSTLRNTDPKLCAYVNKLRMLKMKAKPKHKAPFENVQYIISGVSFIGGRPRYHLANMALLPTGYIAINDGLVMVKGEAITCVEGFWKYPREEIERCDLTCDCINKWEESVMNHLKESKCKCGHLYDLYNTGVKNKEKYFYPATRYGPHRFDEAKIFQLDPLEDFIKDTVKEAVKSNEATPQLSEPTLLASGLKESELLAAFLADLSNGPLLIPHIPQANLLNNLQEWVRKRVKGDLTPKRHKRMLLQSQRRWLDLKHMDFRARAFRIPFTVKQIENINWSHRGVVQQLFDNLMENFVTRNRIKQVEQTRLWWSTMKYDSYPSKSFLDNFFAYMPGRIKDTYFINPYSSELTQKHGAKTCPLGN